MKKLAILVITASAFADDLATAKLLKAVEARYNRIQSLRVTFEQHYAAPGAMRRVESGQLSLKKPGRMRWDYTAPAGKWFLMDGKNLYYYTPAANRVEQMSAKESDDLRTPLAFLLGKLNFGRDFQHFEAHQEADVTVLTANPKSDRSPYREVTFHVDGNAQIRRMIVKGRDDDSVMDFRFGVETVNIQMPDTSFALVMPTGAELVEAGR